MSKAEELATRAEKDAADRDTPYGCRDSLEKAAAHLRALGASHQRLKEALEMVRNCVVIMKGGEHKYSLAIDAALEQAKDLE